MSRWFRHYAGMARDEKLVRAALKSKQTIERVVWVWSAILESAAERNDEGTFEVDAEEMAFFLRCDQEDIERVLTALETLGRIADGAVSKWDMRQFKADSSNERVKRHREKRAEAGLLAQWQPTRALREAVYARDGFKCVYCGSDHDLTIDHKVPEIRGGNNDEPNLQTACRRCNASKRDLTHDEFLERNAVTVAVTPQRTETKTETNIPTSSAAAEPPPAKVVSLISMPDPRADLFARGLETLCGMTGKAPPQARTLLGKWLRDARDEAALVLAVIDEAAEHRLASPVPWIERTIQARMASRDPPKKKFYSV